MNERFYNRDPKDPSSPILPSEDTERRQLSTNQEADLTDAEFHWHPDAGVSSLQDCEKQLSAVVYELLSLWYPIKTRHMRSTHQFSCGWSSYLQCGIYSWRVFSDSWRPCCSIALPISEPEGADFDRLMAGRRTHSGVCKWPEPKNKARGRGWHTCLLYVPNSPIRLSYSMPGGEWVLCQGNTFHREGNNRLRGVKQCVQDKIVLTLKSEPGRTAPKPLYPDASRK